MYVYPSCQLSCEAFSYNGGAWGMGYVSALAHLFFIIRGANIEFITIIF